MANLNSKEFIAAFVKHTNSWGATEAAVGAGNGMLINGDGWNASRERVAVEETNTPFASQSEQSNITFDPTPKGPMRYDSGGLYTMMALALGGVTNATVTQGSATYYTKTMVPTEDTEGLYGTYAIKKGPTVFSCHTAKPYGFQIKGDSSGKALEQTLFVQADQEIRGSTINTTTVMATVTYNDRQRRVLFDQLTFWINDTASGSLSSSYAVTPVSFDVTFKRNFPTLHTNHRYRDEPNDDGHPEIAVNLSFPRIDATFRAFYDKWVAATPRKMQILATGAIFTGASTATYQMRMRFPYLDIMSVSHGFDGLNRPTVNVSMMARDRTAIGGAPTGFSTGLPIEVYFQHLRSTQF